AALALFLYELGAPPSEPLFDVSQLRQLDGVLALFLSILGGHFAGGGRRLAAAAGLAVLLAIGVAALLLWRRRALGEALAPWVSLLLLSLGGVLLIASARGPQWRELASSSRYLGVSVLALASAVVLATRAVATSPTAHRRRIAGTILAVMLALAAFGHLQAVRLGWKAAADDRAAKQLAVSCLLSYRVAPVE